MKNIGGIVKSIYFVIVVLVILFLVVGVYFTENLDSSVSFGLGFSRLLLILVALSAIASSVLVLFLKKGALKSSLISVGAMLLIFVIGYALAGDEVLPTYQKMNVSASDSKWIGGLLNGMFIISLITVGAAVVTSILSSFKR